MTYKNLFGILSLAMAAGFPSISRAEDLTTFPWLVTASDVAGRPWSSSLLVFTSQVPDGEGYRVEGYFDWFLDNVSQGREMVRGTMTSSGGLDLAGYELINPGSIILDVYKARVELSEGKISNGVFGVPQGIAGVWSAVQTLEVSFTLVNETTAELCWDTGVNLWYQVQVRSGVGTDGWVPLQAEWKKGSGGRECTQIPIQPGTSAQYFQVVTVSVPPPAN
ncbi:MAG: hypothetical protein JNL10_07800 [Verrucomicrobiales bacterium]|nr:hypothetical protein [Verrucomicrobiales bacterium]